MEKWTSKAKDSCPYVFTVLINAEQFGDKAPCTYTEVSCTSIDNSAENQIWMRQVMKDSKYNLITLPIKLFSYNFYCFLCGSLVKKLFDTVEGLSNTEVYSSFAIIDINPVITVI